MKKTKIQGLYKDRNKLFTENPKECKNYKVYNEKIMNLKNKQYRAWNPYRSKLSAAILNGMQINLNPDFKVLYLGAATGTTVSHMSDILSKGIVYSVENSAIAIKKLIEVCVKRKNIIPILEDAAHPDRYSTIVPIVDFVYQDISQRNQAEIFIRNVKRYLKKGCFGIIMVKARSINIALKPKEAYELVKNELTSNHIKIVETIDLSPYEKDHLAILIKT
jgi:fibrillarin-like pre-rRNA processing protein